MSAVRLRRYLIKGEKGDKINNVEAEFSPLRWEEKERDRGFSSIIMDTHHPTLISFHRETIYNVPSGTRIIRTTLEKSLIDSGWGSRDLPVFER